MVLTSQEMQQAEAAAFARGVDAASLMEEAGLGMARALCQFFPRPAHVVAYLGKGNNAGDALVAARHLLEQGWKVHARLAFPVADFKELPARHWAAVESRIGLLPSGEEVRRLDGQVILLDGLVGIGAVKGALRGDLAALAGEMNWLRRCRHASTVALDLPSGLDAGSGVPGDPCVMADLTLTVGHVKEPLLADEATSCVGRLALIPLQEIEGAAGDASRQVLTSGMLLPRLPRRAFEFHKGQAGRVGLIAGSRGYVGAAVLAAEGALRGGAGLVTLLVKEEIYPLAAAKAPPEVMVKRVQDYHEALELPFDVLCLGPGLGAAQEKEVLSVLSRAKAPLVLDADALNMISRAGLEVLRRLEAPCLLTPHPGEMARLTASFPSWRGFSRAALAKAFGEEFPRCTLLLKGARTVISAHGLPLFFNSTGHPGMASGGMGDVLSGVCSALAAQKVSLTDAACLGAWACGRAAEIAVTSGGRSAESLVATDVLGCLGGAFDDLRRAVY